MTGVTVLPAQHFLQFQVSEENPGRMMLNDYEENFPVKDTSGSPLLFANIVPVVGLL
jgi:hypothetical protein